jgi:hypothetical protein
MRDEGRACMDLRRPVKFHCPNQLASVLPEPQLGRNRSQHKPRDLLVTEVEQNESMLQIRLLMVR